MLPKCPRGEDDDGVHPFAEAGWRTGRRCHTPLEEAGSAIRGKGWNAAPRHDVVPDNAREDAANEKVVQCLVFLAAQLGEGGVMGKVVARSPVGGPASAEECEADEEFDAQRRPRSPSDAPVGVFRGAEE